MTVQFLEHLTAPGGYGLSAENVTMGLSQWRESEIVAALLRDVERRAPDAIVGRIFTAVNQDGLVVLVGEAGEPENGGDAHAFSIKKLNTSDKETTPSTTLVVGSTTIKRRMLGSDNISSAVRRVSPRTHVLKRP